MEMCSKKCTTLSDLLKLLELTYFISDEINAPISVDPKAKMEEIAEVFDRAGIVEWVDDVSIRFDGWHLISVLPTRNLCSISTLEQCQVSLWSRSGTWL